MDVPTSFDPEEVEARWRDAWTADLYAHDDDPERPDYVIDTPPPYPTGNLHIGNALGWCYMDYVARFKRLQGYDVLFPQGWDCHGLPTEVKVEENEGIRKNEVPRDAFREMCIEHTYEMIDEMRSTMELLGFSQDWDHEYVTMEPEYWGETQRSFVEMHDDGYAYRDNHPVNWCPRCETAIADAEVEREDRDGTLYDIAFPVAGVGDADDREATEARDDVVIATTRPELLAACGAVAVHPDDERYEGLVGAEIEVPLFGQRVELIADTEVDMSFGSGAVMICTFGDKQDVEWWQEHGLTLREVFSKQGTLTEEADDFAGLSVDEAKEAIAEALDDEGDLLGSEDVEQSVGICWRCDTPIEILAEEQWFIEVQQDEVLEKAREVDWIPEHAEDRLEDWTTSMEWDWVISRQRVFATPFPVWYCGDCGEARIADAEDCPVDPTEETPDEPCDCGASDWEPEEDVMDTWMDSSISALYVGGWPDDDFAPTGLREQGHDIIRTWAFYTILRTAALEDEIPWEEALINGMVFGDDGHKMSKSRGNFVQPEEVVEEHGADAFRQAIASAGRAGSDIQFQWKEVDRASRFVTKLWNIYRFALPHVGRDVYERPDEPPELRLADEWILSRLTAVADEVEATMDDHRFDEALRTLREFAWEELADDYVELVKGRLYDGEEGDEGYEAVRWTLRTVLEAVVTMLSPIAPFASDEIHDGLAETSVHAGRWPSIERRDDDAERRGDVQAGIVAAIRNWKSESGMALNADMGRVELYTALDLDEIDVANALNADVWLERGEPDLEEVPTGVDPDMSVIGPAFTDSASDVVAALEQMDPADVAAMKAEEAIEVDVDGARRELDGDAVAVEHELRSGGEGVDVVETEETTAVIFGG